MCFIAVLRGNSATAQEKTAKGAANQVYFLAKLIKAWVEAILDCQLFYGKTMKAWEVGVDFGGDLGWTGKSRYCHILPHCYSFPLKLTLKAGPQPSALLEVVRPLGDGSKGRGGGESLGT